MSTTNEISLFRPIRFPEGKHPEESLHWLGRIVEPFFDLGQRGYIAHDSTADEGFIPIDTDTQKLSKGQKALKVLTVALKIIMIMTVAIPLIMFIGKLIYRSVNYFEEIPKLNTDHLKDEANRLLTALAEDGNGYKNLSARIIDLEDKNLSTEEDVVEAAHLYHELSSNLNELRKVSGPEYNKVLSKETLAALAETSRRLNHLNDTFLAYFAGEAAQEAVKKGLDSLQNTAREAFDAYQADNDAWTTEQDALLNEIKSRGDQNIDKEIHRKLCKAAQNKEIKDYPAIERYRTTVDAFNRMIPDIYSSADIRKFHSDIDKLQKPKGLPNLGNSCYLNSLLQALCAHPGFYQMVNNPVRIPRYIPQKAEPGTINIGRTFQALDLESPRLKGPKSDQEEPNKTTQLTVEDPDFLRHVARIQPQIKAKRLQDSLRLLILAQRSKNDRAIRIAAYGFRERLIEAGVIPARQRMVQQDSSEFMIQVLEQLNYPLLDVVERKEYINPEAKGYVKEETNPLSILTLPIKNSDGNIISHTFQGLVDHYFSTTTQTDRLSLNDEPVKSHTWNETTRLKAIPDTLNISLKRFEIINPARGTTGKIQGQIHMPVGNIVDLQDAFAEGVVGEGVSTKYQIVAVIQHMGGTSGGHYTANVYKNGQWHQCNDRSVTLTAGDVGRDGYVFVLKRI